MINTIQLVPVFQDRVVESVYTVYNTVLCAMPFKYNVTTHYRFSSVTRQGVEWVVIEGNKALKMPEIGEERSRLFSRTPA